MPALRIRAPLLVMLAWLAAGVPGRAADPAKPAGDKEPFNEPADCMTCHTVPKKNDIDRGALNFVLLTEYATWKTQDKHAQAHAVLTGSRGRQMAERLARAGLPSGVADDAGAGCLNCHAMNNLPPHEGRPYAREEGVSCAGCHGVSGLWGGLHRRPEWRENTPEKKEELGLNDLRDPARRAALCLSCHVGDAADGKVVTHAMYVAGHPPLPPVEIALFSKNLPQHWRDAKDVPYLDPKNDKIRRDYHLEAVDCQHTRQVLAGGVVAFRATMRLIADRGDEGTKRPAVVWPELRSGGVGGKPLPVDEVTGARAMRAWPAVAMSHSDCYACHHELAVPSWRQQRGYGLKLADGGRIRTRPGRPQVRPWSMALLGPAVRHAARAKPVKDRDAYEKRKLDELRGHLEKLAGACDETPFGDAPALRAVALNLDAWSRGLLDDLKDAPCTPQAVLALLHDLCSTATAEGVDYEAARLIASAVRVVYDELPGKQENKSLREALARLGQSLDLQPYHGREKRQAVIDQMVLDRLSPDAAQGMKEFARALGDLGNRTLQEKQSDNPFLNVLSGKSNSDITKRLRSREIIDKLQAISDEELTDSLKAINDYGPREFLRDLEVVRGQLPPLPAEK
jgi:hypothetical protein